jgi:hypothetical protein
MDKNSAVTGAIRFARCKPLPSVLAFTAGLESWIARDVVDIAVYENRLADVRAYFFDLKSFIF